MLPRLLAFLLLLSGLLGAQTPPSSPTLQIPAAAQAGPGFDPETATRAYLATLGPEQRARSDSYFEGGNWLILWDFLYGAAISILLLWARLSARMRALAELIARRKPLATWLYWAQYSIALFVLGFPLAVYEGFVREHQYGLSNQTFAAWLIDGVQRAGAEHRVGGPCRNGAVRNCPSTFPHLARVGRRCGNPVPDDPHTHLPRVHSANVKQIYSTDGFTNSQPDPAHRTPERHLRHQRLPGRRLAPDEYPWSSAAAHCGHRHELLDLEIWSAAWAPPRGGVS